MITYFPEFVKEAKASFLTRGAKAISSRIENIGGKVIDTGTDTGLILRDSVSPFHLRSGMSRGLNEMRNTGPRARAARVNAARKRLEKGDAGDYVNDFSQGTGLAAWARRQGLLSNTTKYVGTDKFKKLKNTAQRALPGQMAVQAPLIAAGSGSALAQKQDAQGNPIGWGERIGRAGLGLTSSVVGMRGGMVSGMVSGIAGDLGGQYLGRGVDKAIGAARKFRGSGAASPPATGVK